MTFRKPMKMLCVAMIATSLPALFNLTIMAGDVTGPNLHKDQVLANHTDIYEITFEGDEKAIVAIIGDGDTDLDLFIYDENDNLIGEDTDLTDRCSVEWTPSWTGKYSIKVKNLGSVYNEYVLITN